MRRRVWRPHLVIKLDALSAYAATTDAPTGLNATYQVRDYGRDLFGSQRSFSLA